MVCGTPHTVRSHCTPVSHVTGRRAVPACSATALPLRDLVFLPHAGVSGCRGSVAAPTSISARFSASTYGGPRRYRPPDLRRRRAACPRQAGRRRYRTRRRSRRESRRLGCGRGSALCRCRCPTPGARLPVRSRRYTARTEHLAEQSTVAGQTGDSTSGSSGKSSRSRGTSPMDLPPPMETRASNNGRIRCPRFMRPGSLRGYRKPGQSRAESMTSGLRCGHAGSLPTAWPGLRCRRLSDTSPYRLTAGESRAEQRLSTRPRSSALYRRPVGLLVDYRPYSPIGSAEVVCGAADRFPLRFNARRPAAMNSDVASAARSAADPASESCKARWVMPSPITPSLKLARAR